jgi:hypothetical protein
MMKCPQKWKHILHFYSTQKILNRDFSLVQYSFIVNSILHKYKSKVFFIVEKKADLVSMAVVTF